MDVLNTLLPVFFLVFVFPSGPRSVPGRKGEFHTYVISYYKVGKVDQVSRGVGRRIIHVCNAPAATGIYT